MTIKIVTRQFDTTEIMAQKDVTEPNSIYMRVSIDGGFAYAFLRHDEAAELGRYLIQLAEGME